MVSYSEEEKHAEESQWQGAKKLIKEAKRLLERKGMTPYEVASYTICKSNANNTLSNTIFQHFFIWVPPNIYGTHMHWWDQCDC